MLVDGLIIPDLCTLVSRVINQDRTVKNNALYYADGHCWICNGEGFIGRLEDDMVCSCVELAVARIIIDNLNEQFCRRYEQ